MSSKHPSWLNRMLADLQDFSASLLQSGLAKPAKVLAGFGPTSLAVLLARIELYAKQVKLAVPDTQWKPGDEDDLVSTRPTRDAQPSRVPSDYGLSDGRLLPRVWLRRETRQTLPLDAARWLIWIAYELKARLDIETTRLSKQIEEAKFARDGESHYAIADVALLDKMHTTLTRAARQLQQSVAFVNTQAGSKVSPLMRRPSPFPADQAWQRLRNIADSLLRPDTAVDQLIASAQMAPAADIPFLYQRWCGVQILESAKRLGWIPATDPVGALFLGGRIDLHREDDKVTMWVEPRLSEYQAGTIGWRSRGGQELTPDFLFVTGPSGERDAFVIDATLTTAPRFLEKKSRYRTQLEGVDQRKIAGVALSRRPLRAWAAAPIKDTSCRVNDEDGFVGVIPLHGSQPSFPALEAWLSDVFAHARAARTNSHLGASLP